MKVADVRYTGPMRSAHRRTPEGERYNFHRYDGQPEREWVAIDSVADAQYFDEMPAFEVDWQPLGRLKAASDDALAAISDLGYTTKQKLVGDDGFDLDVAGNAAEDDLEAALKAHVEDLQEDGDI